MKAVNFDGFEFGRWNFPCITASSVIWGDFGGLLSFGCGLGFTVLVPAFVEKNIFFG